MPESNADVPIFVLPDPRWSESKAMPVTETRDSSVIRDAVLRVLRDSREDYLKVHVRVERGPTGRPEALDLFLLRMRSWTADVKRLILHPEGRVVMEDREYLGDEPWSPAVPLPKAVQEGPKDAAQMVFATPVPEIPTAKAAVEHAYRVATDAGYRSKRLFGPDASLANYQKYWTAGLVAFGSIGHGYPGGVVLADGNLTAGWVANLGAKALSPEVVYCNSCQVFNPPLEPAVMAAGARTFIGGIVNLLIGPSEEVFTCFWSRVIATMDPMGRALKTCEKDKYPTVGSHGISGDLGAL